MKGGENMNVIGANVQVANTLASTKPSTSDASSNRTQFFDVLQSVVKSSNNVKGKNETSVFDGSTFLNQITLGNKEEISLNQFLASQETTDGEMIGDYLKAINGEQTSDEMFLKEIEELLNLLPDYLRAEVEELLKQNINIELQEENVTLAEMLAHFIQMLRQLTEEHQLPAQQTFEQLRHPLQQMLQSEAKMTGLNASEIFAKIEKIMTVEQAAKQTYLESVVARIMNTSSQQEQKSGLNMAFAFDTQQPMPKVQQFVIHLGEEPTKELEQQQFLRQFQNILSRGILRQFQNGVTQFTIKLHPEHLGRLDIEFVQTNGIITAKIMASTKVARELIESQLASLRHTFAQQQVNVERIEVVEQQQQHYFQKDSDERQQREERQEKQQHKDEEHQEHVFANILEEISINEKV